MIQEDFEIEKQEEDWQEEEWEEEESECFGRAQMMERFAQYERITEFFQQELERLGWLKKAQDMKQLHLRLKQGPVRLLVIGMSCSGKSTLVNTLAEDFVAPEGTTATSCIPLWVSGKLSEPVEGETDFHMLFQKDNGLVEKPCNMVVALNQLCHAPGEGTDVPEDLAAVTAQVSGGFLWDSGLTLIDTPGIGQQKEDDKWTEKSIFLGAEMLLIAHGSNKKILEKNIQALFPNGEMDLGLNMQKDLFLLGNDIFSTKQGVCLTLKELVAKWNSKGEKRFYWMNILEQRLQMGYYKYSEWYPVGTNDKEVNKKKEREDFEKYQMFQNAIKAAKASGGDIQRGIENYEELKTEQYLKAAPGEMERENILQALPNRKKKALADWKNMEKLRSDLKRRADEIYCDPKRICTPIEKELRDIGNALLKYYQKSIAREEKKIRQEVEELSDDNLFSYEEECNREWKHFKALEQLKTEFETKRNHIAKLRESLEEDIKNIENKCKKQLEKNAEVCGSQAIAEQLGKMLYSSEDSEKKINEDWKEQLIALAPVLYQESRNKARSMLLDQTLFSPMEDHITAILESRRQKEVLEAMHSAIDFEKAALNEMSENALCQEISRFSFVLPPFSPPSDFAVFDTLDMEKCASALGENLVTILKEWQKEQDARKENNADFWLKKLANALRDFLAPNLKTRILNCIACVNKDIAEDIAIYLHNVIKPHLTEELEILKNANEELEKTAVQIDERQKIQWETVQTKLALAREKLLQERFQKLEPKKQKIKKIMQALETLNNYSESVKCE